LPDFLLITEGSSIIESYIDGQWEGWQGDTIVKLTNGQKSRELNFKDDKLDGKSTDWSENGLITSESNCKDGVCISGDCPD